MKRIVKIVECRPCVDGGWEVKTESGMWVWAPFQVPVPTMMVYDPKDAPGRRPGPKTDVPF